MNKKSKKSNFLKNLLTTASVASVIVGGSNAAFGFDNVMNQDNAQFTDLGHWRLQGGGAAAAVADGDKLHFVAGRPTMIADATVSVSFDTHAVVDATVKVGDANAANTLTVLNVFGGQTLTIKADHADSHMVFGDVANPDNVGDFAGLKAIDFNNKANATATIVQNNFESNVSFKSTGAINGTVIINATDVKLNGEWSGGANAVNNLVVNDNKSVIISNHLALGNSLILNGAANSAGGTLTIVNKNITVGGDGIKGANAGVGTLIFEGDSVVTADVGNANALHSIEIKNGKVEIIAGNSIKAKSIILSGDKSGLKVNNLIVTDSIAITGDNESTLELSGNRLYDITVPIGDKDKALKELKFSGGIVGGNARTITSRVYTNAISADGGSITFVQEVDVATTNLTRAATELKIDKGGNLGTVNFNNINSNIIVGAGKNLSGEFYGDNNAKKKHNAKDTAGTLTFAAGDSEFDGTVTNLHLIEHLGGGTLKFVRKGSNVVATIKGRNDSTFEFVNDYKLTGDIDTAGTLNFENAEIAGDIKNVDVINLLKGKTLTVGGKTLQVTKTIFFGNDQDRGGTLAFNSIDDVTLDVPAIGELFGGNIDATKMKEGKTLTIKGNIGTDPTVASSTSLDKILLSGQNLNLQPTAGAAGRVNVAVMDFNEKTSTVALKTADVNYALGELKKAKEAKIEISQNVSLRDTKTTDDEKLGEIYFSADKVLTLDDGIDITSKSITAKTSGQGQLVFAKSATLKGNIGERAKSLKTLRVNDDVEAVTSGKAYFTGNVSLGNNSILLVDDNYSANRVVADTDGSGILRFTNKDAITFRTADTPVAAPVAGRAVAVNAVEKLEIQGGNVALDGNGLPFKKVAFAKDSTLSLAKDMKLSGIDVESSVDKGRPTVQLGSGVNDEIISGQNIGSSGHSVNLALTGDTVLDVKSKNAFVAITTTANDKGTVNFDLGAGGTVSTIDGLGSEGLKLKLANLKTEVHNLGDTYAKVIVQDSVRYEAGGIVDGEVQLGHTSAGGAAGAKFRDNVILKSDMVSMGAKNSITFDGNAEISGKVVGTAQNAFELIKFTGTEAHTATLKSSALYADNIEFGSENIKVAAKDVALHGISQINANINLESNQLTLEKTGTWGKETSIKTILTEEGSFGNIVLKDKVTVAGNVGVIVKISDKADLDKYSNKQFTLIDGANHLLLEDGRINLIDVEGVQKDRAYINWDIKSEGAKLVFERNVDVKAGVTEDLKQLDAKYSENIDPLLEAKELLNEISFIYDHNNKEATQKKRADAYRKVLTNNNDTVTRALAIISDSVRTRMASTMTANQVALVSAGSDDATGMGAWAMPYYSQAVQKKNGDDAGYGVKSVGGVVGFDTLVNDELTIGAAVSVVNSHMKYEGDYAGKTAINTVMGSIYGTQSFAKDFFVQAVASLGSSKIKGTDPRIVPTKTHESGQELAKAAYSAMSYGGEVLFGYNAKIADSALLTPMAGIRYTRFDDEAYKETGTTHQNKIVGKKAVNDIEAVVGARASTAIDTDGITITPEAHAFVSQKLGDNSGKVNVKLEGMTDSFITKSDKAAKTSFNVGLGITAKAGVMEYGAGYDAYLANSYVGHQGTLKVRVNF
ncbi:autotransporter domain-containing protein [Candidatus Tisiphia endosymbiont of Hybos culiciformis]|uniref:autotransporter domain-containing protein n=1 Tax=Candidatus Tisiphia endosymbiont of Hybos culiciformis TaxID=3139331 RepID=UPI003CCAC38F